MLFVLACRVVEEKDSPPVKAKRVIFTEEIDNLSGDKACLAAIVEEEDQDPMIRPE